jgi:hypothetical protein
LIRGKLVEKLTVLELATIIISIENHGEIEVYYDVSLTRKKNILASTIITTNSNKK